MDKYLLLVILTDGLLWLRSGFGKLQSGTFTDTLGETLKKFAGKNPHPFFKDFLENVAIPNSQVFGWLTLLGELFAAITLTGFAIYLLSGSKACKYTKPLLALGLITGIFLNGIFWLAAGWTSPSTDGLNLLMLATQVIALAAVLKMRTR